MPRVHPIRISRWMTTIFLGLIALALWVRVIPAFRLGSLAGIEGAGSRKRDHQDDQQPLVLGKEWDESYRADNPAVPLFPAFRASSQFLPSAIHDPYPDYNSKPWRQQWRGNQMPCLGPRGKEVNSNDADKVRYYQLPSIEGQPAATFGSNKELQIDSSICLDRWSRFNPAGFDDDHIDLDRDLDEDVEPRIDWEAVEWKALQNQCLLKNKDRYEEAASTESHPLVFRMPSKDDLNITWQSPPPDQPGQSSRKHFAPRSAVVMHVGEGTEWTLDTTQYIRSLILELNLHSGAEYEILLMVENTKTGKEIFESESAYAQALEQSAPKEFRSLTTLYNRALLEAWYPETSLADSSAQTSQSHLQTLELLALHRPELSPFWHIPRSSRYTSSLYSLFATLTKWSLKQPRHSLRDRNAYLYIPTIYRTVNSFFVMIANRTHSSSSRSSENPTSTGISALGPSRPIDRSPQDQESPAWGENEPADLITVAPILPIDGATHDPASSRLKAEHIQTLTSTAVVAYSKRLLNAIHYTQITHRVALPEERLAPTMAFVHGFKAVSVPVPTWLDLAMRTDDIEEELNGRDDNGRRELLEQWSPRLSIGEERDGQGVSNDHGFADELYKRWVGYGKDPDEKLCLPPMLLYPVRGV